MHSRVSKSHCQHTIRAINSHLTIANICSTPNIVLAIVSLSTGLSFFILFILAACFHHHLPYYLPLFVELKCHLLVYMLLYSTLLTYAKLACLAWPVLVFTLPVCIASKGYAIVFKGTTLPMHHLPLGCSQVQRFHTWPTCGASKGNTSIDNKGATSWSPPPKDFGCLNPPPPPQKNKIKIKIK